MSMGDDVGEFRPVFYWYRRTWSQGKAKITSNLYYQLMLNNADVSTDIYDRMTFVALKCVFLLAERVTL